LRLVRSVGEQQRNKEITLLPDFEQLFTPRRLAATRRSLR
jgi:hypothetical protein